jgi:hypothetical protein
VAGFLGGVILIAVRALAGVEVAGARRGWEMRSITFAAKKLRFDEGAALRGDC